MGGSERRHAREAASTSLVGLLWTVVVAREEGCVDGLCGVRRRRGVCGYEGGCEVLGVATTVHWYVADLDTHCCA